MPLKPQNQGTSYPVTILLIQLVGILLSFKANLTKQLIIMTCLHICNKFNQHVMEYYRRDLHIDLLFSIKIPNLPKNQFILTRH